MKRIYICIYIILLILSMLTGCGKPESNDKQSIVCTTFPQYDWTKQILGDKLEQYNLTMLLDNQVDLHSYQPTVNDIAKIYSCDLFIYVGGESEGWVEEILKEAVNNNMVVINLMEQLGDTVLEEEIKEGMQPENEPNEEDNFDEHVWLSLRNAKLLSSAIADSLSIIDKANSEDYHKNLAGYLNLLSELDSRYLAVTDLAVQKTLLFGDRMPFSYLLNDYGIDYYAAFAGCSAETEVSFKTVIYLAEKMDELGLETIIVTESGTTDIARTII
ncbi:MAG: metal ABC transporter substrate-binding protein, partial [Oscillospiraceae bacterium]|nr:metal ABC transporter substrate-binding protein [Oscillospiraceae bacterium]